MYKIKVNNSFEYDVEQKCEKFSVNGESIAIDAIANSTHSLNIIFQNKSFNTEVVEFDQQEKKCVVKVNGTLYAIQVEDQFDQLLKRLGMDSLTSVKIAEVKAPMPGLVLKIVVNEGDVIEKGDNLLILEAMKMENIIKSTANGVVKKVLVEQGAKVEKNQVLIQFC